MRAQGRHPANSRSSSSLRLWDRAAAEDPAHDDELSSNGNLYLRTSEDEHPLLLELAAQARAAGLVDTR